MIGHDRRNHVRLRTMTGDDVPRLTAAFDAVDWHKPASLFQRYLAQMAAGSRFCLVAELANGSVAAELAGYCTLVWQSEYPPFRESGIPEIKDLNVLPNLRRHGCGSSLLAALESAAGERGPVVGLGVGLYADYGAAQRLYAARGYRPDGRGIMYREQPVEPGSSIAIDDDACLFLTLDLAGRAPGE